jgi:hypothetical protein
MVSQWKPLSHCASFAHIARHWGATWLLVPVQKTGRYAPHALASVFASQPESSCTITARHCLVAVHSASMRSPWQVTVSRHVAGSEKLSPQSPATEQQSPPAQQNPFWQCPETQSLASSHIPPSTTSGTQVPSQWKPSMHSPSVAQLVAQLGAVWTSAPVQKRGVFGLQSRAWVSTPHAVSSGVGTLVPHIELAHVASRRVP